MKKRQGYANGGGAKTFKNIAKLDSLTGNNKEGVQTAVTIKPSKNTSIATRQQDGRNVSTTLNLNLPNQKASASVSRSKSGSMSGRVTKDTSNFLGKDSAVSFSVARPKGGGDSRYGITYSKRI